MADHIPKENRQLVQGRSFGRCERCFRPTFGEVHHRRPKGMGGSSDPTRHNVSNLVLLCTDDHRWAHAHPTDAAEVGFLIPRSSGRSPLEVPIVNLAVRTWFLDDEGQYLLEPVEAAA